MKKRILISLLVIVLLAYLFFYLAIELDLKFGIEQWAYKIQQGQLADTASHIRTFITVQLFLFIPVAILSLYLLIKRK